MLAKEGDGLLSKRRSRGESNGKEMRTNPRLRFVKRVEGGGRKHELEEKGGAILFSQSLTEWAAFQEHKKKALEQKKSECSAFLIDHHLFIAKKRKRDMDQKILKKGEKGAIEGRLTGTASWKQAMRGESQEKGGEEETRTPNALREGATGCTGKGQDGLLFTFRTLCRPARKGKRIERKKGTMRE